MRLPFGSMCVLLVVVGCGGVGREHALPVPARPGLLAFRAPLILLPCLFFLFSMSWTGGSFALTVYQVGDVVAPTPTPAPVTPAPVPDTTGGDYTGLGCAEDLNPGPNGGRVSNRQPGEIAVVDNVSRMNITHDRAAA